MKKNNLRLNKFTGSLVKIISLCIIMTGTSLAQEKRGRGDQDRRPPRKEKRQDQEKPSRYSIEQAVSENAQLHTIAFSGLAFLTGDFGASTFMPPGKVCDYFGFQYMRDIDAAEKGHNPMFLNRVAGNVLHILNEEQKQKFLDLAEEQAPQMEKLARMRLPLIKAFHLQSANQLPKGSQGLNKEAVTQYVGDIFAYDAEISLKRAQIMAEVARSLTDEQKAYFDKMKFGDFNTWPDLDERDKIRQAGRGQSMLYNVAYMTFASEFFSWIKGNVEADTYFCPERHGTYFGGFYMKDMPAMGKRNYDISTSVTGDSGRDFLDALTQEQSKHVLDIPELQKKALMKTIDVRRAMAVELRKLLSGESVDRKKILAMGREYGRLDGEMSWYYATAFAKVNATLSNEQRTKLMKIRNLEEYTSAPYYIYSRAMQDKPSIENVDRLFFDPKDKES